jgi:ankyrin repeat protein
MSEPEHLPEDLASSPEDSLPLPALHRAALDGELAAVADILANGADVNETLANGMSALSYALRRHRLNVAHLLVDSGADVNCVDAEIPPLHDAASLGDLILIDKMLERGANIHARDRRHGLTVLMRSNSEHVVRLLVQRGARIEDRNSVGRDAIAEHRYQAAAIRRHEEERRRHYNDLAEMTKDDPELQAKLLQGQEELSRGPIAEKHDALAVLLERLRR